MKEGFAVDAVVPLCGNYPVTDWEPGKRSTHEAFKAGHASRRR